MRAKNQRLIMLNTPVDKLNELIKECKKDLKFSVKNAEMFISKTMGYEPIKQENEYDDLFQEVQEVISFGVDITMPMSNKQLELKSEAATFISELKSKFEKLNENDKELKSQLKKCETAIEKYRHFTKLDVNLEEVFNCEFISMRFGYLSKSGYDKLMSVYGENPYILFKICTVEKDGYWGAYFAPKDKVNDIDAIFVVLNFDRLYIPAVVGTVEEAIENIEHNIEILKEQIADIESQMKHILSNQSGTLISLYFDLLDMQEVFEMKRLAVQNNKNAFFVGTVPEEYKSEFVQKIKANSMFKDVFVSTEKYKSRKKSKK